MFACGCIVDLPPLHTINADLCVRCHPQLANVIEFVRKNVA